MSSNKDIISLNEVDVFPFTGKDKNINDKLNKKKLFISSTKYKDRTRKEKPDNMRKKYKAKFHKTIRNIINTKLHKFFPKKICFVGLPQDFIKDVAKDNNSKVMNLKYEDLFDYTYKLYNDKIENKKKEKEEEKDKDKEQKKEKEKEKINENYLNNKKILEYLNSEKNKDKSELSGWNIIKNMKYTELLDKFFLSKEFEDSINDMEKNNEKENYINEYISYSKYYTDFFKTNTNDIPLYDIIPPPEPPEENNLCPDDDYSPRYFNNNITKEENSVSIDEYDPFKLVGPKIIEDDDCVTIFEHNEKYNQKILSMNSDINDNNRYYIEQFNEDN